MRFWSSPAPAPLEEAVTPRPQSASAPSVAGRTCAADAGATRRMAAFVTQSRTKYIVHERKELCEGGRLFVLLRLSGVAAGNLRQLTGFDRSPRAKAKEMAAHCEMLSHVRWLTHAKTDILVPIVAFENKKGWIAEHAPELQGEMAESSLKDLLNGSKPHVKGWKLLKETPRVAQELGDGVSIVGLRREPSSRPAVDYGHMFDFGQEVRRHTHRRRSRDPLLACFELCPCASRPH